MRWFVSLAALFLLLASENPAHAEWQDVTATVARNTTLDEQIRDACNRHCQGNRRAGTLRQVRVRHLHGSIYEVEARASLKNHHHVSTMIGGGFAAYEYAIETIATGPLDRDTCILTVERIRVVNDRLGLSEHARREEGKSHKIENCEQFL